MNIIRSISSWRLSLTQSWLSYAPHTWDVFLLFHIVIKIKLTYLSLSLVHADAHAPPPPAALSALGEHHSLGQHGAQGHLSMMEHCTSTHGHGGLGPAIFVTIPAAVPVESRALAPAVALSALSVTPPAAAPAPAPAPKFRPNSFAIVVKYSPFVFYLLVFFQQRTRTLFLWGTHTSHTHRAGPLPHT